MTDTLTGLVIALPWGGALLVSLVPDKRARLQHGLAVFVAGAAALISLLLLRYHSTGTVLGLQVGGAFGTFAFVPDGFGVLLAAIACVIGCLAVIFSVDYMRGEAQLGRYYALVLFFIGSMAGLVLTSSMLLLFAFWEITSLCSFALIAFYSDDPKAVAGGIKALVITQIGGIGLLVGALLLYAHTGSYDIGAFLQNPGVLDPRTLAVMAFGLLIAAAAKSAQFPFFTWLPDAMEAPTPISALIHAATMVNAGVYILGRFYGAFAGVPGWSETVVIIGLASAVLAGLMALSANDLKRVLAYSTVSQLGYMVYAVGVGGLFASQFHLLSHAVFKALLFLGAGAVIHSVGTRDMRQMGGLGKKMPVVRLVFVVGALALAGLPILNGFWSKELVLEAGLKFGVQHGWLWSYGLMVFGAGLTAAYALRCVWMVFYGAPRNQKHVHDAGPAMQTALLPLAAGALLTWLLIGPVSRLLAGSVPPIISETSSIAALMREIGGNRATWGVLGIVALGLAGWAWHAKLTPLLRPLAWLESAATHSFGLEWINRMVVKATVDTAEATRSTQTGLLNWNLVGIVGGLIVILIVLVLGA